LSQVTNLLGKAIDEALQAEPVFTSYQLIYKKHIELAADAGICNRLGNERLVPKLEPLIKLLDQLRQILAGVGKTGEISSRLRARISSFGELMSTRLGVLVLQQKGVNAIWADARDLLCSDSEEAQNEDDKYLDAAVRPSCNVEAVNAASKGCQVVITQGFIARTSGSNRSTCLLGRGGSDTSAALFAALVDAARLEIWTDVHGLFTSDPRQVPTARLLKRLNYREAFTMAAMGAKVLHQRCLRPAEWASVPVEIRNTLDPKGPHTCICQDNRSKAAQVDVNLGGFGNIPGAGALVQKMEAAKADPVVLGIASCKSTLITVTTRGAWGASGFLARVLTPFTQQNMSVDLIACSQYGVSLTLDHIPGGVDGDGFKQLCKRLEKHGAVKVKPAVAVVSIIGRRLNEALPEIGEVMADALPGVKVHMMSVPTENLNLSFVVDSKNSENMVCSFHRFLFRENTVSDKVAKVTAALSYEGSADSDQENKSPPVSLAAVKPSSSDLYGATWEMIYESARKSKTLKDLTVSPSEGQPRKRKADSRAYKRTHSHDDLEQHERITKQRVQSAAPQVVCR
jgi:diaminopimelate decarboxylase/aspartate kinase